MPPSDRDEHGRYTGAQDAVSDHGPVEAAYLAAIVAFAEASNINRLEIREPAVTGFVHFGVEPPVEAWPRRALPARSHRLPRRS